MPNIDPEKERAVIAVESQLDGAIKHHEQHRQSFVLAETKLRRKQYEDDLAARFTREAEESFAAQYPAPDFATLAESILGAKTLYGHLSVAVPTIQDPEQRAVYVAALLARHKERKGNTR